MKHKLVVRHPASNPLCPASEGGLYAEAKTTGKVSFKVLFYFQSQTRGTAVPNSSLPRGFQTTWIHLNL